MVKKSPFQGRQRDKLILALQMQDLLIQLNTALHARHAELLLDYIDSPMPKLFISMPGTDPEPVMVLDQRKHCCYHMQPGNRDLFLAILDIRERLYKFEARLVLVGNKPPHGARRAALQIQLIGVPQMAITLMETTRGHAVRDTAFQLPDGTNP